MKVYVWTINDPVRMSILLSRGVDGIITDDPALAREVLGMRAGLSPVGRLVLWAAGETGFLPDLEGASEEGDA
jgi:glycerophosphoryl diester phosphodiesterase